MQLRNILRRLWSRQSLAAKLTLSYTTALLLLGSGLAVFAGLAVTTELRREAAAAAEQAAIANAAVVESAIEGYHRSLLMAQAETAVRVIARMDPKHDVAEAITYVTTGAGEPAIVFLLDENGTIVRGPDGAERDLSAAVAELGPAIAGREPGFAHTMGPDGRIYDSFSEALPGWEWIVVAIEPDRALLDRLSGDVLNELLASSVPVPVLAAAIAAGDQSILATLDWGEWSAAIAAHGGDAFRGVEKLDHAFGERLIYLATADMPRIGPTLLVVYRADRLEQLVGRVVLLIIATAAGGSVVVWLVSRQTARLVTAPVRRATARLIGPSRQSNSHDGPRDELRTLLRELLRTSVRLDHERRQRAEDEDELAISATVYRNIGEGIVILDPGGSVNRVNPAFTATTGLGAEDLVGRSLTAIVAADNTHTFEVELWQELNRSGAWVGETEIISKSGDMIPVLLSVRAVSDSAGKPRHYICVARDISDIRSTQDRLQHLATHDPLTGLTNRTYLSESLQRTIEVRRRRGGQAAVLFIDVDHFKDVNDAHGHHAGDELLQVVAARLNSSIRSEDIIVRFGGDEFVVVISEIDEATRVDEVARRMLNRIREPAIVNGITIRPSATAGVAIYPESGSTPEDLLKNADAAMYAAKKIGRGGYRYHDPAINEAVRMRFAVQDRVRFSLRTSEFVLLWQPVVRVADLRVIGAEALIRRRTSEGLESPAAFMPQIEGSQVMMELASWVVAETAATIAEHHPVLPDGFRVAVNVSATEILQRDFVPLVREALETHSAPAARLAVEVTEGAAIRDVPTAKSVISELRRSGISVYLDDFGVGYSSLQYLRELGVDVVKLDKSFLEEVPESDASCSLVRGVVEMSHGLGLRTTIEGVEHPEQLEFLRSIDCDAVQGYFTGEPMAVERVIERLVRDAEPEEKDA